MNAHKNTIKVILAGIAAHVLYRLQFATCGRIGGFALYHWLWQIYTLNYQVQRTGYVLHDLKASH